MPTVTLAADADGNIILTCQTATLKLSSLMDQQLAADLEALLDLVPQRNFRIISRGQFYFITLAGRIAIGNSATRQAILFTPAGIRSLIEHLPRFAAIARAISGFESVAARQCDELRAAGYRWYLLDQKNNIGHWGRGGQFGPDCEYTQATAAAYTQFITARLN